MSVCWTTITLTTRTPSVSLEETTGRGGSPARGYRETEGELCGREKPTERSVTRCSRAPVRSRVLTRSLSRRRQQRAALHCGNCTEHVTRAPAAPGSARQLRQVGARPRPSGPRAPDQVQPFAAPTTPRPPPACAPLPTEPSQLPLSHSRLPQPLSGGGKRKRKRSHRTDLAKTLCRSHLSRNRAKCYLLRKAVSHSLLPWKSRGRFSGLARDLQPCSKEDAPAQDRLQARTSPRPRTALHGAARHVGCCRGVCGEERQLPATRLLGPVPPHGSHGRVTSHGISARMSERGKPTDNGGEGTPRDSGALRWRVRLCAAHAGKQVRAGRRACRRPGSPARTADCALWRAAVDDVVYPPQAQPLRLKSTNRHRPVRSQEVTNVSRGQWGGKQPTRKEPTSAEVRQTGAVRAHHTAGTQS